MNKKNFDDYSHFEAKYMLEEYEKEIGKFVLCEAREENSTRLFLHRFNTWTSAVSKNGWWDTFTVSELSCEDVGLYLCRIKSFRVDRNNFLNMQVQPAKFLGTAINEDDVAWEYFYMGGCFSKRYFDIQPRDRINTENLYSIYQEEVARIIENKRKVLGKNYLSANTEIANFFFTKFLCDEISIQELNLALEEKYDIEKLADDLTKNVSRFGQNEKNQYMKEFPLLVKKLPKNKIWDFYDPKTTMEYLRRKDLEYDTLNIGEETNLLKRVEAVLLYWEKQKEEKKRLKKEARKLKGTKK